MHEHMFLPSRLIKNSETQTDHSNRRPCFNMHKWIFINSINQGRRYATNEYMYWSYDAKFILHALP